MKAIYSIVLIQCVKFLFVSSYVYDSDYLVPPKCQPCEARLCPQLTFCAGKEVKDHCGCCPRCSSDLFQPHAPDGQDVEETTTELPVSGEIISANPCEQRKCPKFKVCMINVQGLPICTCPSAFVCKRGGSTKGKSTKDETVCGTDGKTYESRCHLRIANCNSKRRIKQKYSGECSVTDAIESKPSYPIETFDTPDPEQDTVFLNAVSKAKRRKLKQKRRKGKKKKQREKRRQRKEKERLKKKQDGKERKRRRMKRRNRGFNAYAKTFDPYYLGKYTKWSRSQVRKSRL
ncbi:Sesquiterpene synthase Agr1 [Mactra antiquata]